MSATIFAHFRHGGHEPEVVISHYIRHLAGPPKELFYSFRNDKSDGMYANSVRQLVMYKTDH